MGRDGEDRSPGEKYVEKDTPAVRSAGLEWGWEIPPAWAGTQAVRAGGA